MFNWKMAYAPNYLCKDSKISSIADIKKSGFEIINAEVPGNFELDLMREGRLCDLYYSTNTLKAQKLENMHVWDFSEIEVTDKNSYLHFEGIDTVSEIYINGSLVKKTDNMFIPYDVSADFNIGKNEVVVHILPTCIEAGKYEVTPFCFALKYNYAALNIRKAAHMFGWDIMPRIVSAGLWKPVSLKKRKSEGIKDVYFITNCADVENRSAEMRFFINADTDGDYINDYSVRVRGRCGDSEFDVTEVMWNSGYQFNFKIDNAKFWFPKNYGEPSLYETEVTLLHKENIVDTYKLNVGIRTIELDISDSTSEDDIGEFCFKVNGRRIFAMGSNWVPLDAFHSQDTKRLGKAFEMLDDLGCNIVRCWGGNVYESDEFFDFCDRHGIMVWQDFAMGCGVYPQTLDFTNRFKEEAVYQIKRLRNHPSLIAKEGRVFKEVVAEIASIVDGPISAEVISLEADKMVEEALELSKIHKNIVIKIPMAAEGLKAVSILSKKGIKTNVTLIFSPSQALLAARAGASYVSPFVGRLNDISSDGNKLVESIAAIFDIHGITTEIIAASIRSPEDVADAALSGAHIATIPYKVICQMIKHPLTDAGIERFLKDWEGVK